MSLPPSRRTSFANNSFTPPPHNAHHGLRPSEIALTAGALTGLILMTGLQISMWRNDDLGELNFLKTSNGWVICGEWAAGVTLGALTGYASFRMVQAMRTRCSQPTLPPSIFEEALLERHSTNSVV